MFLDTENPCNRAGLLISAIGNEIQRDLESCPKYSEERLRARIVRLRSCLRDAPIDRRSSRIEDRLEVLDAYLNGLADSTEAFTALRELCGTDACDCLEVAMIYGSPIWRRAKEEGEVYDEAQSGNG